MIPEKPWIKVVSRHERGTIEIEATCGICHQAHKFTVIENMFKAWLTGELIQNCLPTMSADDRELLISGNCGPCFDKVW